MDKIRSLAQSAYNDIGRYAGSKDNNNNNNNNDKNNVDNNNDDEKYRKLLRRIRTRSLGPQQLNQYEIQNVNSTLAGQRYTLRVVIYKVLLNFKAINDDETRPANLGQKWNVGSCFPVVRLITKSPNGKFNFHIENLQVVKERGYTISPNQDIIPCPPDDTEELNHVYHHAPQKEEEEKGTGGEGETKSAQEDLRVTQREAEFGVVSMDLRFTKEELKRSDLDNQILLEIFLAFSHFQKDPDNRIKPHNTTVTLFAFSRIDISKDIKDWLKEEETQIHTHLKEKKRAELRQMNERGEGGGGGREGEGGEKEEGDKDKQKEREEQKQQQEVKKKEELSIAWGAKNVFTLEIVETYLFHLKKRMKNQIDSFLKHVQFLHKKYELGQQSLFETSSLLDEEQCLEDEVTEEEKDKIIHQQKNKEGVEEDDEDEDEDEEDEVMLKEEEQNLKVVGKVIIRMDFLNQKKREIEKQDPKDNIMDNYTFRKKMKTKEKLKKLDESIKDHLRPKIIRERTREEIFSGHFANDIARHFYEIYYKDKEQDDLFLIPSLHSIMEVCSPEAYDLLLHLRCSKEANPLETTLNAYSSIQERISKLPVQKATERARWLQVKISCEKRILVYLDQLPKVKKGFASDKEKNVLLKDIPRLCIRADANMAAAHPLIYERLLTSWHKRSRRIFGFEVHPSLAAFTTPKANFIFQALFYLTFVLLLLSPVFTFSDKTIYWRSYVEDRLLKGGGGHGVTGYDFTEIRDIDEFWHWSIKVLPYGLFEPPERFAYMHIVGQPTIRQFRVKSNQCPFPTDGGYLFCQNKERSGKLGD